MYQFETTSRDKYLNGNCNVFALAALDIIEGDIICLLEDRSHPSEFSGVVRGLVHCFVQLPDGMAFDANGVQHTENIINHCTILSPGLWVEKPTTKRGVLEFGYVYKGGSEVEDIATARQYILDNLIDELSDYFREA